ncbi:MAG: type II/IV secretion system protein [Epsilonproteobacteria bacterium]|nr:MAG: type II/IV secretion system protein [Campylobacterota bacterium]
MINIPQLNNIDFEPVWIDDIDMYLAIKYFALFSKKNGKIIIVLTANHINDSLEFLSKIDNQYEINLTDEISFERLLNKFLEIRTEKNMSNDENTELSIDTNEEEMELKEFLQTNQDLLNSEDAAPVIKLVNSIFYQAIKKDASDIHIEIHEKKGEIRFRIDGALNKYMDLDQRISQLAISRIKVISSLDISEKRVPQDGRTQVTIANKKLDIRVSILPTYYGERVVMRILMESSDIPSMEQLGFKKDLMKKIYPLLEHSHGMILVTGPTGSGKSTTLHSFLQQITSPNLNVITVEDPVEYNAENINQVQTNTKVNLTFASALRSILRQDPDVVMIGEMRDKETAHIGVQAALTGHLVFSTLHTNTSTGAITRLVDMGVEEFLISSSLLGVLSQRLVRKLCVHCKTFDNSSDTYKEKLNIHKNSKIYKAIGCNKCHFTGYSGRVAIGELFVVDEEVKKFIKKDQEESELRNFMRKKGMITIQDRLVDLINEGTTSFTEALRIGIH